VSANDIIRMPATGRTVQADGDLPTPADWAAAALLAAACVAAPLALGATGAWPRFATEAAMGLAAVIWGLSGIRRPRAAFAPLLISAVLTAQLMPLPDRLLVLISPVSAAAWKVASADAGGNWGTITVDPATTAAGLRRLLLSVAAFVAVANLGRCVPLRRLLCGALCIVCLMIWTLGLAFPFERQKLVVLGLFDRTGPIAAEYWKTPIEPPIATNGSGNLETITVGDQQYQTATWIAADAFGPYIYSNHFAGAMCLTLPVLLGVWLTSTTRRVPAFLRHLFVAMLFASALWTVGVMATSRAGGAALIMAGLVFASLTIEVTWLRRTAYALTTAYVLAVLSFTMAFYGGIEGFEKLFPSFVQPRVEAMLHDGRALAARAALRMFASAPLLGSGLGTFGELFPRFLRTDFLLNFAHNDYAQWLAETGLLGAGMAIAFATLLVRHFRRWVGSIANAGVVDPLTAGLWAALSGIGVHTAYDWNLHIPANALLAGVVAGLAVASKLHPASQSALALPPGFQGSRWPGLTLAIGCVLAVTLLARDAASDSVQRDMRAAIVAARLAGMDTKFPDADSRLRNAIRAGNQMMGWDPANGHLGVLVGLCHLHLSTAQDNLSTSNAERAVAQEYFALARRRAATCRGLPERIPSAVTPVTK